MKERTRAVKKRWRGTAGQTRRAAGESETAPERCNLYARSGGQTRLVAVLSGANFPDWSLPERYALRGLTVRVSPSGRYLAFMSRRSLSGYDNRDAQSAKSDEEVFRYDSGANGGEGGLECGSCDPSGARREPLQADRRKRRQPGRRLAGCRPAGAWDTASVPAGHSLSPVQGSALYQSRYLSDSGRLFNGQDALVPRDGNGSEDVYSGAEAEAGVGDCEADSGRASAAAAGGCVALIFIRHGEGRIGLP